MTTSAALTHIQVGAVLLVLLTVVTLRPAAAHPALVRDLSPITLLPVARHPAITLVSKGRARAVVYVADPHPSANLTVLLKEFIEDVKLSTGAELTVVTTPPPANQPAIVIGDSAESRAAGIDAAHLPIEGFVVKTARNRVFLVGSMQPLPEVHAQSLGGNPYANDGTAWAVADFIERFVGIRWYWPTTAGGRSVVKRTTLAIPPTYYTDQPVFRKREFYPRVGYRKGDWRAVWWDEQALTLPETLLPAGTEHIAMQPLLAGLRSGNSWPYIIKVHEPQHFMREWEKWSKHPEMFQQKADGTRDLNMLCYSSQETLDYLLHGCEDAWDHGKPVSWVTATCVTVSPGDYPVRCYCEKCAPLYAPDRAPYGASSKVMGLFVKRVCEAVKARWPEKNVLYLPYWNYTECPDGIDFPDNLNVQMCTMAFGLMRQAEPRAKMEQRLRTWSMKIGGPITTWEYSHRVPEWTYAPVQYPHLVQDYYRTNRELLAGSFLNGGQIAEWSTAAPTAYCWMKVLWNPDVNIEAMLDEMCRRMYGKAAGTCRALLRLECDRWEKAPWREGLGDAGHVSPAVIADSYPPDVVATMIALRDRARREMAGDTLAEQRFAYWTWTFDHFLIEAQDAWKQTGIVHEGTAGAKDIPHRY
ncbi:MAG TPA: DUF4838 domain-containing protein [Candidatus Hydrogenedentes bacterium]|nr:DUF4838 domain-containing protein [Candidatus Hydrogenedentota bacterium]